MSATLCPEPVQLRSGVSLEQILARAHESAQLEGVTDCPVCGGDMASREFGAHCDDCGSHLF